MPDRAMISHRGEKYAVGRGKRFYGIWLAGAPEAAPVDRWPESRDGWEQAWTRFAELETPGTIRAVDHGRVRSRAHRGRDSAGPASARTRAGAEAGEHPGRASRRVTALLAGEGLLVLGVVLSLAGLFPGYAGGQSLLSDGAQVVPHLIYVVTWAVSAGVIALGVARPGPSHRRSERAAALLALGLSAVTFGLFVADAGEVITGGAALGTGLVVSLLGWLACTVGAGIALSGAGQDDAHPATGPLGQARRAREPGLARPTRGHVGPLALLVLGAIGTAAAFAPSWDRYALATTFTGTTQTVTEGNAFANPALVIAGNVCVMAAIVAVAAMAALWRPARQGALLLAGAIVPLAAKAISALIQVRQPAVPSMFGISGAEASAAGLTISSSVTAIFWVYCVFVIALLISCAWLFTAPEQPAMPVMPGRPSQPWPPITGPGQGPGAVVGEPAGEADHSDSEPLSEGADSDDGGGGDHSAYAAKHYT